MSIAEIHNLIREYESCDSISRRKEIIGAIEKTAHRVFKLLCINLYGFEEKHSISGRGCYLDSSEMFPWDSDGICVVYESTETDDDNRYNLEGRMSIPYKYFNYSDLDWKNLANEKIEREIDWLNSEIKGKEVEIKSLNGEIARLKMRISVKRKKMIEQNKERDKDA